MQLLSLLCVLLFELLSSCVASLLFLQLLMFFVLLRLEFLAFLILLVVKFLLLLLEFLIPLGVASVWSSRTFRCRQVIRVSESFGAAVFVSSAVVFSASGVVLRSAAVFASDCVIAMEVAGPSGCNSCRAAMVV